MYVESVTFPNTSAETLENYLYPKLGAANTPYARSIPPNTITMGALPDPGLIFDSVMAREEFKPRKP